MKLLDFPTSAKEALETGKTWFMSHRACPIHNLPFHWAHNSTCMSCRDIEGKPYMIRATNLPRIKKEK